MSIPDELWRWILELGVNTSCLTYKDLCCPSMSCRRLNRLSKEHGLWSNLLSSDFPTHSSSYSTNRQSPKSIYQIRFEKDKVKKLLAERRAVLRIESRIHEHTRKLHEIEGRLVVENEKLKAAIDELKWLRKVKESSTALKVWQPEIIRSSQKQIVENCSVPVDVRVNAVEMEIKLCKQHISGFVRARKDENDRREGSGTHSDKRRKSSESGDYRVDTPDDAFTFHMPDLNEDTTPTRPKRKEKKKAESSTQGSGVEILANYASNREKKYSALVDSKISYLEEQKAVLRQRQLDREMEIFMKPHDHVTGPMLEILLNRKREIAAKYNWPCNF